MTLIEKSIKAVYTRTGEVVSDMQGPCDTGFHVALKSEWNSIKNIMTTLGINTGDSYKSYLKMPYSGNVSYSTGTQGDQGTFGVYNVSDLDSGETILFRIENSSGYVLYPYNCWGASIRPLKDTPVVPDSSWTALYSDKIYHNSALGLISLSSDGTTWITIADKNLGATTVYNSGDTLSEANCGKYYQRGNNYGFPFTGTITTSSTKVNASTYGPGNYYSSSTFITNAVLWDTSSNANLRGGVTQQTGTVLTEHKIRPEVPATAYTISDIPTSDTNKYINVSQSGKTIQSVKFNFTATGNGAFVHISSNNSNTSRYGIACGYDTTGNYGQYCAIRGRLNGASDTWYRQVSFDTSTSNQIEFFISRDGNCYISVNGAKTSYTAGSAELNIIQTIMNYSDMNCYASQAGALLTGNKVDIEVVYS